MISTLSSRLRLNFLSRARLGRVIALSGIAALLAFGASGCFTDFKNVKNASDAAPAPPSNNTQNPTAPTTGSGGTVTATFAQVQQQVIQGGHCLECHDAGADTDLSSYQNLVHNPDLPTLVVPGNAQGSLLWTILNAGKMPKKYGKLPQADIDLVAAWINNGAKDDGEAQPAETQ